ncbi:hypothetical protein I549_3783 [Mycobacterium avium subsp. avium 2285 (R)]|nr:hypothetical protein I549_3783 [Mycobacterium avium subsp. avium 2285 (R)]
MRRAVGLVKTTISDFGIVVTATAMYSLTTVFVSGSVISRHRGRLPVLVTRTTRLKS